MKRTALFLFTILFASISAFSQDHVYEGTRGSKYQLKNKTERTFIQSLEDVVIQIYFSEKKVVIQTKNKTQSLVIDDIKFDNGFIDYIILVSGDNKGLEYQLDMDGSFIHLFEQLNLNTLSFTYVSTWEEK